MTKTIFRNAGLLLVLFATMLCFTSCEEDDEYIAETLIGEWRVVEIETDDYDCPYSYGDIFGFEPDGGFYTSRYEYGEWDIHDDILKIDFTGDGYPDVNALVLQIDYGYVVLDVHDSYYETHYRLCLVRNW